MLKEHELILMAKQMNYVSHYHSEEIVSNNSYNYHHMNN
jgi:hypothetical protein